MNHLLKSCAVSAAALAVAMLTGCTSPKGEPQTFEIGNKEFLLNGKPFLIKAAEIHYTRIPAEYWEHRIEMCKALGMNTICIYIFWNIHEQEEGKFDFTGQNDIAAFCRAAQKHGMYVIVRPGPYVCAEWEMAAEKERCGTSYARSLLHGACGHLHERSRQATGTATGEQRRKYYHGTGRKRIRFLWH